MRNSNFWKKKFLIKFHNKLFIAMTIFLSHNFWLKSCKKYIWKLFFQDARWTSQNNLRIWLIILHKIYVSTFRGKIFLLQSASALWKKFLTKSQVIQFKNFWSANNEFYDTMKIIDIRFTLGSKSHLSGSNIHKIRKQYKYTLCKLLIRKHHCDSKDGINFIGFLPSGFLSS